MRRLLSALPILFLTLPRLFAQCCPDNHSIISAFAGNGSAGYSGDGGPATLASVSSTLFGITSDAAGNVYLCDTGNQVIRKISPSGIITTVAGNGTGGFSGDGGLATSAQLSTPVFVAVDGSGNLYIADYGNNRIRKVSTTGVITTFAGNGTPTYAGDGGPATSASLNGPFGVTLDAAGNVLIADRGNYVIRSVNSLGTISTVAGAGTPGFSGDGGYATSALLSEPEAITQAPDGDIFFYDDFNYRLRKINTCGIITTVGGTGTNGYSGDGGPATSATLGDSHGTAFCGTNIYLADVDENVIRMINTCGVITTIAGNGTLNSTGNGGSAGLATLSQPQGLTIDPSGNIYFSQFATSQVRKIAPDCSPSPTPACLTPTPVCTSTLITPTPTNSPTGTITPVPPTHTPTITPTPTITLSPTLSPTSTISPTPGNEGFDVSRNLFTPPQTVDIYVGIASYPGDYDLTIYNSAGEHIRTLDHHPLASAFSANYSWDGKNKYGDTCASGVYLICLTEPFARKTKRVLLIR